MNQSSSHPLSRLQDFSKSYLEAAAILILIAFWIYLCKDVFSNIHHFVYISFEHVDAMGQYWMVWWASQALHSSDLSLFHCPLLNHPIGAMIFAFDVAYVNILLAAFMEPVFGLPGSINVVFCCGILISLLGVYSLLRQITSMRIFAACLATLPIYQRLFLHDWYVDIDMANMGFMAFAIAMWLSFLKRGTKRRLIAAGILTGITCAAQMYYGIFVFGLLAVAILLSFVKILPAGPGKWSVRNRTLSVLAIGAALAILLLWPSITALFQKGLFLWSGSPGSIIPFKNSLEPLAILPIPLLALLALIVKKHNRQLWFWLIVTSVFLLLGMGPYLVLSDHASSEIPLPMWLLYKFVPFFWRFNTPRRFALIAFLALVCLLARLGQCLLDEKHLPLKWRLPSLIGLFCAGNLFLMLIEGMSISFVPHYTPVPAAGIPQVPQIYKTMGSDPDEYAVFDILCGQEATWTGFYQINHGKPIAGHSLIPDEYINYQPVSELSTMQRRFCDSLKTEVDPDLPSASWFVQRGVRYLVLHELFLRKKDESFLLRWETRYGQPVFASKKLRLYFLQADAYKKPLK